MWTDRHTDRWADMMKLMGTFHENADVPNKVFATVQSVYIVPFQCNECQQGECDMIYLNAIGLTPGGSSTVHIYTQTIHEQHNRHKTIHRTTQYMEQHN